MHIAVISPYYKETIETLTRCHDSVMTQRTEETVTHFLVADGYPQPMPLAWDVQHLSIPNNGDYGDTPRMVGAACAATMGYDGVIFLDSDNWIEPDHVQTLVDLFRETKAPIITATRTIYTRDAELLGVCKESDGKNFNDTNCWLIMRPAFKLIAAWGFKERQESITGDRVFFDAVVKSGVKRAHSSKPTVNYTTDLAFHYQQHGRTPPPDSRVIARLQGENTFRNISYEELQKLQGAQD